MSAAFSSLPLRRGLLLILLGFLFGACDATSTGSSPGNSDQCKLSSGQLTDRGLGRDVIPALTNPSLVEAGAESASYLSDDDRVIGLLFGEAPLALPHSILRHHEVANFDDWTDEPFAVTYCPFTGSSLAFKRKAVDGAEFGVSGVLLHSNLVMYDRRKAESLWPQMSRGARCGPETGTSLSTLPIIEMTWGQWRRLHPDTKVLSSNTGFDRNYAVHSRSAPTTPISLPTSLTSSPDAPAPERVLGLPEGPSLALSFEALDNGAAMRTVQVRHNASSVVVFWHRAARSAMAFRPRARGRVLSFTVRNGHIVDTVTGSTWTIDGRAVEGPMTGAQLPPIETAHVAFWTAWKAFHPETRRWSTSS